MLKLALAIHSASGKKASSFRRLPSSSVPPNLLDAFIFGSESPSGTQVPGAIEEPGAESVFIDELANLPAMSQFRLLELLSEGRGAESERSLAKGARLLCASSRNLEELVAENLFRSDLFYKISVLPIFIPPLRERLPDIPAIVAQLLRNAAAERGQEPKALSDEALRLLMAHAWPGNDAELESCVASSLANCQDLPQMLQAKPAKGKGQERLSEALDKLERNLVSCALAASGGNIAKAASALGVTERVLGLRIKKFGLDPKIFKRAAL
jgi:Nif-specific regulatory protein